MFSREEESQNARSVVSLDLRQHHGHGSVVQLRNSELAQRRQEAQLLLVRLGGLGHADEFVVAGLVAGVREDGNQSRHDVRVDGRSVLLPGIVELSRLGAHIAVTADGAEQTSKLAAQLPRSRRLVGLGGPAKRGEYRLDQVADERLHGSALVTLGERVEVSQRTADDAPHIRVGLAAEVGNQPQVGLRADQVGSHSSPRVVHKVVALDHLHVGERVLGEPGQEPFRVAHAVEAGAAGVGDHVLEVLVDEHRLLTVGDEELLLLHLT